MQHPRTRCAHPIWGSRRGSSMLRFALYLAGISTAVAAYVAYQKQKRAMRRIPVKEAAALLQQAWADHHTRA